MHDIKFPKLNPDGVSVKGCNYIYAPRGQAGECAPLAANPYRGCGHRCVYCYVPNVIKMPRRDFDAGATPRANFLAKLRKDARKYETLGVEEQVMFSFTTDVYNPFDTSITRHCIGPAAMPLLRPSPRSMSAFQKNGSATPHPQEIASIRSRRFTSAAFLPGFRWSRRSISSPRSPSSRRRTALSICTRLAASTICL
jgi:hypothetical protein